jgi:hypothetical protein
MNIRNTSALATLACIAAFGGAANATEGGGSAYPAGAEGYTCCAIPPPGLYGMVYGQHYDTTTLRNNSGDRIPVPGFKVTANALVPRLIYVTPKTIFGGQLALEALLPLVDLEVDVAGASDSRSGPADLIVGAALGWHLSPKLHTLQGFDIFVPVGSYDSGRLANLGRNYWTFQTVTGVTYIDPAGFNADAKVMFNFNGSNSDTRYHSGHELVIDYAMGWGVASRWVIGVGGYVYQQLNDDKLRGNSLAGSKGRAFAIGPSIRYDSGKGWFATAKYQEEMNVRNRADGSAFWLKVVKPF